MSAPEETPEPKPERRGFRVVIVGGGPVGLGLANMLSAAGIDHVVLERRANVVEESGFGLAFWPHGVRLLDQLGMLEEAHRLRYVLSDKKTFRPDGSEVAYNKLYDAIEEFHGHPWLLVKRQDALRMLYERLPDRESKVMVNKKVTAIETYDAGVVVRCEDGSAIEGSIVVGCDGAYSPIRGMMNDLALSTTGKEAKSPGKKKPVMTAPYQVLVGHLHRIPDMVTNRLLEVHGPSGYSFQIFMLEHEGWFLAYKRLDPVPKDTYVRYTEADADAFAAEIMDRPIGEGMTFRDLWEARQWVRLVTTEEGMAEKWYSGRRVVLVGDSAHKMTPNAGLSSNQGWQGAASLTNGLRRLLLATPEGKEPDAAALELVFRQYRRETLDMAKGSARASALYIRATSWHSPLYRVIDWLVPKLGGDVVSFKLFTSPTVRKGLLLDFLPEPGYKAGKIAWVHRAKVKEGKKDVEAEKTE